MYAFLVSVLVLLLLGCTSRIGERETMQTLTQVLNEGGWQACIKLHVTYPALLAGSIVAVRGGVDLQECLRSHGVQAITIDTHPSRE